MEAKRFQLSKFPEHVKKVSTSKIGKRERSFYSEKENSLSAENVATAMGRNYTDSKYQGADEVETANALALYNLTYRATNMKLSWSNLKNNVVSDCPFIIGITAPQYNAQTGNTDIVGHMLVGYGYSCDYGDEAIDSDSRYVYTWDPNGVQRYLQYHASGYSIYGYTWTWVETLVD